MREADRIASARRLEEESAQFKLSPLKTELKRRALRLGLLLGFFTTVPSVEAGSSVLPIDSHVPRFYPFGEHGT